MSFWFSEEVSLDRCHLTPFPLTYHQCTMRFTVASSFKHGSRTCAYLVDKITCFIGSPTIREFHYVMFHGVVVADEDEDTESVVARVLGSNNVQPLRMMRNMFNSPDVLAPEANFVVSERVRDALSELPNIAFLPIECKKLIHYPYRLGDFSWYDDPECRRPDDLYSLLDTVSETDPFDPSYAEILTPRLGDIQPSFSGLLSVDAEIGSAGFRERTSIMLNAELLASYPILSTPDTNVFSSVAFAILKPYLDPNFFAITEVELPEGN